MHNILLLDATIKHFLLTLNTMTYLVIVKYLKV